jgi:predicted PurR-regulated permease PerM
MRKSGHGSATPSAEPDVTAHPTPIRISRRTRTALILAVLVVLAYVVYRVPSVLTTAVGGIALALVLSFPVRFFTRFLPRGLSILLSFLLVVGLFVLAALYLVPLVAEQFAALVRAVPGIATIVERYVSDVLGALQDRGLVPSDPQELVSRVRDDLVSAVRSVAGNVLGGALGFVFGTFGFVLTLFGVVFIGVYLLVDVRRVKAAWLRAWPHGYRRDARTLWNAFGYSLSRYLGGLALVLAIQGVVSAVGLFLLGVPYALVLGAFVSVTAVIPYLGAWLSAIPAVIVALTVSPTTALLTALLFLGIQQLEGNFLTPKIQGNTLHVHPILVFLAVIVGGGLGGIFGVIVAVPALAVLRVVFDFFRVRLRTKDDQHEAANRPADKPRRQTKPDLSKSP